MRTLVVGGTGPTGSFIVNGLRERSREVTIFHRGTHEIVEIPTYYADHFDVMTGATGFDLTRLGLDRPGLKVFDFHPNIIFVNASTDAEYIATKSFYHDPERLLAVRRQGTGARTLLLDLLAAVCTRGLPTATVGEVNAHCRAVAKWT